MYKKLLIAFVILASTVSFSQTLSGRVSASMYTFERVDSANTATQYIRDYQQLFLNASYKQFSLKTSMNFEFGAKNSLDADPRLRVYNLYLEGRKLLDLATVRLGRQPIFSGFAGGVFDGALVKINKSNINFESYYGGLVPSYQELKVTSDWGNNYLFGGNLSANIHDFRLGVAYVDKNIKYADYYATRIDSNLNPINYLVQKNSAAYKYFSGEFSYLPEKSNLVVRSKYEYDVNLAKTSKVELEGEIPVTKDLDVVAYGNYREPHIRYNSIFSVFDYGNTKEGELGASYKLCTGYSLTGKFGYVKYKDDESSRLNVNVQSEYGSVGFRKAFGYSGELYAFDVNAAYGMCDGLLTPSVSVSYGEYKLSDNSNNNHITTVVGGVNVRPIRSFSIDIQGQYMDNPIYKNDVRLLLKLNYWFFTIL